MLSVFFFFNHLDKEIQDWLFVKFWNYSSFHIKTWSNHMYIVFSEPKIVIYFPLGYPWGRKVTNFLKHLEQATWQNLTILNSLQNFKYIYNILFFFFYKVHSCQNQLLAARLDFSNCWKVFRLVILQKGKIILYPPIFIYSGSFVSCHIYIWLMSMFCITNTKTGGTFYSRSLIMHVSYYDSTKIKVNCILY